MNTRLAFAAAALVLSSGIAHADARQDLLKTVGIKPERGMRGQMDAVGFVTNAAQMDSVLLQSRGFAAARAQELAATQGWNDDIAFCAAVCPHDDYYYASRLYALLIPHIKAKRVILFGVFHKARVFECRDRLVFDSFPTWRGPYGPVKVSPLRDELLARLPKDHVVVDNDMQQVEHSVEAIVPWLQASNRDVEIVSILVPHMGWETIDKLSGEVSTALAAIMKEKGWKLGTDVAIISSADAVHYGDAGWGGNNYADFGTTPEGYEKAVERDRKLAESLAASLRPKTLRNFLYTCVDSMDVMKYKVTWCGRFSVPFGLSVASRVNEALGGRALTGTVLDYGTSLGEVSLDLERIPALGTTAPNNLHHWVGYAAIGYRATTR
ncbi:MAG TPA: AmmeMemoRadiSam system protein B [Candidatus Krumholzibacteria bacterium]